MRSIRCQLGMHTTEPRENDRWYPMWRCSRCGHDLRANQGGSDDNE